MYSCTNNSSQHIINNLTKKYSKSGEPRTERTQDMTQPGSEILAETLTFLLNGKSFFLWKSNITVSEYVTTMQNSTILASITACRSRLHCRNAIVS